MYNITLGLEVHVELNTKEKLFCYCENVQNAKENTKTCEICLGMPGALPILNEEAVEKAVLVGKYLNCKINYFSKFDRKHYFYIDAPKNFQTTQFYKPICSGGYLEVNNKKYEIERIHLEEDAGKITSKGVDYNRSGVPLIEIVTKPCFKSFEEMEQFLNYLRQTLIYGNVSNCKMNEGAFRFDINMSISKNDKYGTRTEIKNMNSFSLAKKAIEKEYIRQKNILDSGEKVLEVALGYDESKDEVYCMRKKETQQEYKFIVDNNVKEIILNDEIIKKYTTNKKEDIKVLIDQLSKQLTTKELEAVKDFPKIMEFILQFNDYKKVLNVVKLMYEDINVYDKEMCKLPLNKVQVQNILSNFNSVNTIVKEIYQNIKFTNIDVLQYIEENNLVPIEDKEEIKILAKKIVEENEKIINDYKNGNKNAINSLVGKGMQLTKGKVKADKLLECIKEII